MRFLLSLLVAAIALIPTWIFLAVRGALNPTGFWQNLATGVAGIAFLGGMQIFLLIFAVILIVGLWKD